MTTFYNEINDNTIFKKRFCIPKLLELTANLKKGTDLLEKQKSEKSTLLFSSGLATLTDNAQNANYCSKFATPTDRFRRGVSGATAIGINPFFSTTVRMALDFQNSGDDISSLGEDGLAKLFNSRCESINNIPYYESVVALYMSSHVSAITPSVLQCINKSLKVIEKQRVNILESCGVGQNVKVRIDNNFVQNSISSRYTLVQNLLGIINPVLPICLSTKTNDIAQSKLPKPELERMMTNLRIFNQLTNDFNPVPGSRIILNNNSFNLVN